MRTRAFAIALATFAVVALVITLGAANLLRTCAYVFTPNSVCGLGICSAPYYCTAWSPAFILGPCVGLLAGLAAAYRISPGRRPGLRPGRAEHQGFEAIDPPVIEADAS